MNRRFMLIREYLRYSLEQDFVLFYKWAKLIYDKDLRSLSRDHYVISSTLTNSWSSIVTFFESRDKGATTNHFVVVLLMNLRFIMDALGIHLLALAIFIRNLRFHETKLCLAWIFDSLLHYPTISWPFYGHFFGFPFFL